MKTLSGATGALSSFAGVFSGVLGGQLGAAVIQAAADGFRTITEEIIKTASALEQAQLKMEVMTQSVEVGKQLFQDIAELAVASPFQFQPMTDAAVGMLGMGVEVRNILPALAKIGVITGGNTQQFQRFALAFGQVIGAGRLRGEELRQLYNAGLPVKALADAAGMNMTQFRIALENGRVGVDVLLKAMNNLTTGGGVFAGMLERQANSLQGSFNALREGALLTTGLAAENIMKKLQVPEILQTMSVMFMDFMKNAEGHVNIIILHAKSIGNIVRAIALGLGAAFSEAFGDIGKSWEAFSGMFQVWLKDFGRFVIYSFGVAIEVIKNGLKWATVAIDVTIELLRGLEEVTGIAMPGLDELLVSSRNIASLTSELMGDGGEAAFKGIQAFESALKSIFNLKPNTGVTDFLKDMKDLVLPPAGPSEATVVWAQDLIRQFDLGITPLERFNKELRSIAEATQFGLAAGPELDFALSRAFKTLEGSFENMANVHLPKAMLRGTQEAESYINKITSRAAGRQDPMDRIRAILEQARRAQEETARNTRETADAVRGLGLVPTRIAGR